MRYPPERKEAVLKKMLPPRNKSIRELAEEEGISGATLYNWRKAARAEGRLIPVCMPPPGHEEGYEETTNRPKRRKYRTITGSTCSSSIPITLDPNTPLGGCAEFVRGLPESFR